MTFAFLPLALRPLHWMHIEAFLERMMEDPVTMSGTETSSRTLGWIQDSLRLLQAR